MTTCYVCSQKATGRVTVTHVDARTTRYAVCDSHEPRYIPGGDVVTISVKPVR